MTEILFGLKADSLAGLEGIKGRLTFTPSTVRYEGSDVVVPRPVSSAIVGGELSDPFEVPESDGTFYWVVTLGSHTTGGHWQWNIAVPDLASIELVDLIADHQIDPTTYEPVSPVQSVAEALALKAPLASPAFTGTPTGITKTHVGLGNVDNTSDMNKPVSTAQAAAIAAGGGGRGIFTPAVAINTALAHGRSTTIQLVSDSTGTDADEWFGLLGELIGEDHLDFTVQFRQWNHTNQNYDFPVTIQTGTAGERKATLATARLQFVATGITGDLDVRAKIAATDWTPAAAQCIAARWETTSNQRGWVFQIDPAGTLSLLYSTDGSATVTATSTASVPFADAAAGWVRATLDVDNGASGRTVTFYTSTDGVNWSALGTAVTVGTAITIFNSTAAYSVGSYTSSNTSPFAGDVYWVEIRSGIDGYHVVSPLLEDWDQTTSATGSFILSGAPVLSMIAGAASGQNIAYFDDSTRKPKLLAKQGQDLIILSTGHNESQATNVTWVSTYSTWVASVKVLLPNVPIVAVTQNPTMTPLTTNQIQMRSGRWVALAAYAAATVGVYLVDTYPAFTDLATQIEVADGLHPTQGNVGRTSGSDVWAAYVHTALAFD